MIKCKILFFFYIFQQKIYFYKHPLLAQVESSLWRPGGLVQCGGPWPAMCRCVTLCHHLLHTRGIGSSGELSQHFHVPSCLGLSQQGVGDSSTHSPPRDAGTGTRPTPCRALPSAANPAVPLLPVPQSLGDERILLTLEPGAG